MKKPLNEKIYVINSFLYLFTCNFIVYLLFLLFDKYNLFNRLSGFQLILLLIVGLIIIYAMIKTSKKNQFMKNIMLLVLLVILSVITYPLYNIVRNNTLLPQVLISYIVITISIMLIAYTQSLHVFDSWGPFLFVSLIGLIVIELVDLLFYNPSKKHAKIYSYLTILLFVGFLLYDTNLMRQQAIISTKDCKNKSQFVCTDYPTNILNLLLDDLNIFSGISGAYAN